MKKLLLLLLISPAFLFAQIQQELDYFNHIIIHPHIQVEFQKGPKEKIEIMSLAIDPQLLTIENTGKKLRLYLDGAKVTFRKLMKDDVYWNRYKRPIKVRITYTEIKKLVAYGEERLTIQDELKGESLQLKLHGEVDINMKSIFVDKFKVSLYGENKLKIGSGSAQRQIAKLYGANEMDARNVIGSHMKFANFGDNRIYTGNLDLLKVTALGDAYLSCTGNPALNQKLTIGDVTLVSRK